MIVVLILNPEVSRERAQASDPLSNRKSHSAKVFGYDFLYTTNQYLVRGFPSESTISGF